MRDPFGIPDNSSDNRYLRAHVAAAGLFDWTDSLRVSAGLDLQNESGASDSVLGFQPQPRFKLERTTYAPFVEAHYTTPFGLVVQGGLRVDFPDGGFGRETSPRIGVLYRSPSLGATFKANWGEGFKLPSFFALGNSIVGNPGLKPETSRSVDLGIVQEFQNRRGSATATIFYNKFRDLIDLVEGPPPQLVNRSQVTTQGVELGLAWESSDHIAVQGHLSYIDSEIKGTDEELRNRPQWRAGLGFQWRPRTDLLLGLDTLYVGQAQDSSIPTGGRTLDDYIRVDIAATWTPAPDWRLRVAIDNLFDQEYEEAIGVTSPGINVRVGAGFNF